jgi:amino acid adenylation domain-containing protein
VNNYNIVEMISRASLQFANRIAIEKHDRRLSYAELEDLSNGVANHLIGNGAERGSIIAVSMEDVAELIISIIGVLKAGCIFAPLDPRTPTNRLERMIGTISPEWIITETGQLDRLRKATAGAGQNTRLLLIDGEEGRSIRDGDLRRPDVSTNQDDGCYIYFTSGSTGEPKAIVGCQKGLAHFVKWEIKTFGITENFRISQLHPASFDPFLRDVFVPLCAGGTVCIPESKEFILDAKKLSDWIESSEINLVHCIPTLLKAITDEEPGPQRFNSLKYILLAGEQLFPSEVKRWMNIFGERIQLVNLYGPTETTLAKFCYFIKASDQDRKFIPVGKPIEGARALVLRDDKTICPPGVVGEVFIRTPFRTLGYYNRPELTKEVFIQNPFNEDPRDIIYKTGDMGRMTPDGDFELLGRRDHQVKIRGIRIELGEIEKALREHEAIRDAVAVAWEDSKKEKFLCAYIVSDRELQSDELTSFLSDSLPENAIPSGFVRLEALPRNLNGKVDRKALSDPRASIGAQVKYVAPSNDIESKLVEIWESILQVEHFGINHNFFELGGHSLKATRVVSRINREFQVSIPLGALFEFPTIAGLAAIVHERVSSDDEARDMAPPLISAGDDKPLALSFAQQRLWVLNRLEPDSPIYNIPAAIRLKGSLNVGALNQTLGEIVRRHQILRTIFPAIDGEPIQIIQDSSEMRVALVDLQDLLESQREAETRRLAAVEINVPFNLAEGPLIRALLIQLGEEDHVIIFTMHHIVCDGWSMDVLVGEVTALYKAYCNALPSPLAGLEIQYADFAVWQREWLHGDVYERLLDYWKDKLAGAPGLLDLPTDRPRPAVQTARGDCLTFALSESSSKHLKDLSRQEGVTMFMTLLAAFEVLLYRYSNQTDIVVGTPIANRNRSELENLIGFFVNTLVLRTDLGGTPSFIDLLTRVRKTSLDAYAHQDLPFEKLVELIQPERSMSHSPLFQMMFGLQNNPRGVLQLPGLTLSQLDVVNRTAKFDLTLMMDDSGAVVTGAFEYNTDLFDASTISRLISHFQTLLEGVVNNPHQPISRLPMISAAERSEIFKWNKTGTRFSELDCLHRMIEAQVERTPDAVAAVFDQQTVTYRDLNSRANQLARYLQAQGVGPEALVGVCMHRSIEMIVSLLGVLKAGAAYVPIDPDYPADRQAFMIGDSELEVLLTNEAQMEQLGGFAGKALVVDRQWPRISVESGDNLRTLVETQNLAYMIYTSGSTGKPKGAMNTHGAIANRLLWMQQEYGLTETDRVLQKTPFSFDVSVWELFWPLMTGARLVIAEPGGHKDTRYLIELIEREQITTLHFVPSMLQVFMQEEGLEQITSVRRVICSGEALSKELVESFYQKMSGKLENLYGPTEAAVDVTKWSCEREGVGVRIGKPISNVQIEILDEEMEQVPVGVKGEVYIGGEAVGRGYWRRADLTAEKFTSNPYSEEEGARLYRTGDIGRYDERGEIEYLGRADNQVKVRGYRIELGEIEAALVNLEGVSEAVVTAREDGAERMLVAHVVGEHGAELRGSRIREKLTEKLPAYMVPAAVVLIEQMPLTHNGKIDRKCLAALEVSRPEERKAFVGPRDFIELNLKNIWEEVLGVRPISTNENFFELGGHSLLAVRVIARILNQFKQDLPLATLFQEPTIQDLAKVLRRRDTSSTISPLVKIQQGGSGRPFFCVHPSGGNVLCYLDLARHLDPDQTFYGLQDPPRLNGGGKYYQSIEEMASVYVESARAVQPNGPYLLGGYSFGGVVAYEMAQHLIRRGEEVALLAILDSGAPINARQILDLEDDMGMNEGVMLALNIRDQARRHGRDLPLVLSDLLQLDPDEQLSNVADRAKKAGLLPPEIGLHEIDNYIKLHKSRREVIGSYVAQPYPGRVTLLRTNADSPDALSDFYEMSDPQLLAALRREQEAILSSPTLGWERLTEEPVDLHFVPGNHHSMLFEPDVEVLAERLGELISKAEECALVRV